MGMSDSMEPGNISELVVNGELAFRVRFDQPAAERESALLARPGALGDGWTALDARDARRPSGSVRPALIEAANPIDYEVVLEPTRQRWLFALDLPVSEPDDAAINPDFQLLASQPVNAVKRYAVRSALAYRTAEPDPRLRELALRLPANITPRMRQLVADWRTRTDSDWGLVQLGPGPFQPRGLPLHPAPAADSARIRRIDFLFETRSGFCEHYASSFALLMRIGGVPARIVLGYLGGEDNTLSGYKNVYQSDAHAWVEVLIAGRGWVRVDPTAAVDPSRIDNRGATRLLGAGTSVRFDLGAGRHPRPLGQEPAPAGRQPGCHLAELGAGFLGGGPARPHGPHRARRLPGIRPRRPHGPGRLADARRHPARLDARHAATRPARRSLCALLSAPRPCRTAPPSARGPPRLWATCHGRPTRPDRDRQPLPRTLCPGALRFSAAAGDPGPPCAPVERLQAEGSAPSNPAKRSSHHRLR